MDPKLAALYEEIRNPKPVPPRVVETVRAPSIAKPPKPVYVPQPRVVYFVSIVGLVDSVKIGSTDDIGHRLQPIRTFVPHGLILHALAWDHEHRERDLQYQFRALRIDREWFRHEGELAAFIEERKAAMDDRLLAEAARSMLGRDHARPRYEGSWATFARRNGLHFPSRK